MKLRLSIDVIENHKYRLLKHVKSVDNHVTILIQLYHMGVGMIFHVKEVLASIGCTKQLIIVKLNMMLIIVFHVLQY